MPVSVRARILLTVLATVIWLHAGQTTMAAQEPIVVVGTITQIDHVTSRLTVSWRDGDVERSVELAMGAATSVTREGVGVSRAQLQVGVRVTVIAMKNIYVPLGVLEATDIMLGHVDLGPLFSTL